MSSTRHQGNALLWLFVFSGFAGLIYQSVWSHYLGLTLGHAAYAQALVLAIFMGGMAVGAWLASRFTPRWRSLILMYALIELAIGLFGLAFHPVFAAYTEFSSMRVLPSIQSAGTAHVYQWVTAAVLIAPQCVLLGATFPILSAGYLRLAPDQAGAVLGGLYFTNSVGAALGALATAFLLLPAFGMPGTIMTAALINILVGFGAWWVWHAADDNSVPMSARAAAVSPAISPAAPASRGFFLLILFAAAITGGTSFVYEIGWVRLLNQALGTTVHAFELMLAAFILGLAFGGYHVRRRARRALDPVESAGYAQVMMGIAALLSIPVFNQSFRWVGGLMGVLSRDESGYLMFSLGSGLIAMAVMFPAAFFAGMTLPLFTLALLERGNGETSIGRVYAANTLGAIIGVFATVFLLVPWIGLRLSIALAALLDIALGLYLLRVVSPTRMTRGLAVATASALLVLAASLHWGRPDLLAQVAGVFRSGAWRLDDSVQVPYFRDGQTSTVALVVANGGRYGSIVTNGKSDATLSLDARDAPTPDEETMILAAALPLAIHPDPADVAVIGWGSGLTTHTLLGSDRPKRVDTIEIERAMHQGASLFGTRVERAYLDPRSNVIFDDARTYFATGNRRYDVVISEPSNPWVSGVASLFTREFYGFIHEHLEQDGVLVQWLQTYELTDALLATMVAALLDVFPDVDIYLSNQRDLILVAYRDREHAPDWTRVTSGELGVELTRVGLAGAQDFSLRRIGGGETLSNLVWVAGAMPHSDFHPRVALEAPKARFMRASANFVMDLVDLGLPVQDMLGERGPLPADTPLGESPFNRYFISHSVAVKVRESMQSTTLGAADSATATVVMKRKEGTEEEGSFRIGVRLDSLQTPEAIREWSHHLASISSMVVGQLPSADVAPLYQSPSWLPDLPQAPPAVQHLVRMYEVTARRSAKEMLDAGTVILNFDSHYYSPLVREQALIVAMLGALASGDGERVELLEREHGSTIPPTLRLGPVRSWLRAWVDRKREAATLPLRE